MPHETKALLPEQFLLVTLMVKLALVAVLATMLVRFPVVSAHPPHREARLARTARLRGQPRRAAHRRRARATALELRGGGSDALRRVPRRSPGRALRRRHRRVHDRHSGDARGRVDCPALRDRLRICRRRPAGDLPEGSDLALFAALLHRPPPLRLAPRAAARRSTGSSCCSRRRSASSCCGSGSGTSSGTSSIPA